MIRILDDGHHSEVLLLAYADTAAGALFTMVGWMDGSSGLPGPGPVPGLQLDPRWFDRHQYTAADEQGASYQLSFGGGTGGWQCVVELRPDPPREIRWLDVFTSSGVAFMRISLNEQNPADPGPAGHCDQDGREPR